MKTYFTMWAWGLALVQAALAGGAGTAVVEQRIHWETAINQTLAKGGIHD